MAARPQLPTSVLAVAGLCFLAVTAAAVGGSWTLTPRVGLELPVATRSYTPPPALEPPTLERTSLTPDHSTGLTVFTLVLVVAAAAGFVMLARWLWRALPLRPVRPAVPPPPLPPGVIVDPNLDELRRGADDALTLLDQVREPRDAVVRCWLALEQAAERSGTARRPSDTPTEFTVRVLTATPADAAAVRRLLGLYHRARFSGHEVDREAVVAARDCVRSLSRTWRAYEAALRASVPGPSG